MKAKAKLLTFGQGGHTIYYKNGTCQGYASPEKFVQSYHWWAHPAEQLSWHFEGYEYAVEGIPVIDKREAVNTPAGYKWVFQGPLVDVELAEGEVDVLGEVSPLFAGAVAENDYGKLLAHHAVSKRTQSRGSLDSVSIGEYVQGWREHGARIGRLFVNGLEARIEWEDQ